MVLLMNLILFEKNNFYFFLVLYIYSLIYYLYLTYIFIIPIINLNGVFSII